MWSKSEVHGRDWVRRVIPGCDLFGQVVSGAAEAIFPRSCALCDGAFAGDERDLCGACRKLFDLEMAKPFCSRCGHNIGPYGMHEGKCGECRHRRPYYDGLIRLGSYSGADGELVRRFKYGGRVELSRCIADLLWGSLRGMSWIGDVEGLVFVPTHWRHRVGRLFYAPKAMTRELSVVSGIQAVHVLRRVSAGPHQMDLPRSKRALNIRGKFAMWGGADVSGATLCLVDDVSTTGATLGECAKVLKRAGARRVYGVVISKVNTGRT